MRIPDLIRRTIWAAGGIAAAKLVLGLSVPLPDAQRLSNAIGNIGNPLLRLYDFFSGGAVARGSVFALGVMPYVSARIMMFCATRVSSRMRTMSESKRKWWTRGLTVGYSLIQSFGYARFTENIPGVVSQPGLAYTLQTMLVLTSASTLLMLFAEEATSADDADDVRLLPRAAADIISPRRTSDRVRDPLYVSHPTPLP